METLNFYFAHDWCGCLGNDGTFSKNGLTGHHINNNNYYNNGLILAAANSISILVVDVTYIMIPR